MKSIDKKLLRGLKHAEAKTTFVLCVAMKSRCLFFVVNSKKGGIKLTKVRKQKVNSSPVLQLKCVCSLAIRLWQQTDTVAGKQSCGGPWNPSTSHCPRVSSSSLCPFFSTNLMKSLINTCKSCTKLQRD